MFPFLRWGWFPCRFSTWKVHRLLPHLWFHCPWFLCLGWSSKFEHSNASWGFSVLGLVHIGPKSEAPSHLRSICVISTVESMEVGIEHFTWGPKSYVPSMTWMPTWEHFLEVRLGTCVESWVEQEARPNAQHSLARSLHKTIKIRLNEYRPYFNGFLRLKNWDFCLHVRISLHEWDLGSHMNQP